MIFNLESLHGGEEDGEGGELGDVEHYHVLVRLLAVALGVGTQTRPLYHNLVKRKFIERIRHVKNIKLNMAIILTFGSKQLKRSYINYCES